jgi:hypothetical protein
MLEAYSTKFPEFLESSVDAYQLRSEADAHEYISDHARELARRAHADLDQTRVAQKDILPDLFERHGVDLTPSRMFGTIADGVYLPLDYDDQRSLDELLLHEGLVLLKPRSGTDGSGVFRVQVGDRSSAQRMALRLLHRNNYVVCPLISQAGHWAARVWPHSLNTIRAYTIREDPETPAFLAKAVHRFGTVKSDGVDNWAKGGIVAPISSDGHLGAGRGRDHLHHHHPDSHQLIYDRVVPNWPEIVNSILNAHDRLPGLPHIGWDVVVNGEGEVEILEINLHCGLQSLQMDRGLRVDPRVARFYDQFA